MRFADAVTSMCRSRLLPLVRALAVCTVLAGCADGFAPLTAAPAPAELEVTVLRPGAVRLTWMPVKATTGFVRSYIIERRVAIEGAFVEVARVPDIARDEPLLWIDTDVAAETIYGYRIVALTDLGDRSAASVVGGVVTPAAPGIEVSTSSTVTTSESLDPDGYQLTIMGPDTVRTTLNDAARRRFSPLRPGAYTVTLSGIIDRCSATSASQQVVVTDTSARTIVPVRFDVTCKDPNRGEFIVTTTVTGDDRDNAWTIDVLGQASDTTIPPADRVTSLQRGQTAGAPSTTFDNLRPGTYTVTLRDLAANCTLTGSAQRSVTVTKLGSTTLTYAVSCAGAAPPPAPVNRAPFIWRNRWTPRSAATGASVVLETTLDLTARSGQAVKGVQANLRYDPAVLRFEEEDIGQLTQLIVNGGTPGLISFIASTPGNSPPRTGVVSLAKFRFTVVGASGTRQVSTTSNLLASSPTPFQDSVQVSEDTLTIGSGGQATNQPPVAQFTGPTTATVGTAVQFNGGSSTDPDGTIASYAWTFGDNTTAAIAAPSKTYSAPGTYSVTLTVTDNRGATASRTASVVVSAGGGGAPPGNAAPVARANGPYTGQAGTPLTLSSAGSTNAVTYTWALGNGQTATGASPTVTYATAGTYTIVLTVTSGSGATNTAQTTATITTPTPPQNATPLVWRNVMQAYDAVNNSVALQIVYDINANIPETPGPEALRSFVVDSLKWDTSKLQFLSLNYGPGMTDVATNQTGVSSGRIALRGSTTPGLDQGNVVIATIRFRPVGTAGQSATTTTFLGPLLGTTQTNSYSYNSKTSIVEGQFTLP